MEENEREWSQNDSHDRDNDESAPLDDQLAAKDYWRKLLQLASLMIPKPMNQRFSEEDDENRRQVRKRATASVATFVLVWYFWRRRRTRNVPLLSSLLALGKSLTMTSITVNDGYQSAVDAPLSSLMQAAKIGTVSRALLMGSDSIAYQVDGVWKKSALPLNNPSLTSNLLELLSENGCSDVSALPESLLSRLATPALAALPFVYLYFVYRMMRNMHGTNDAARTYSNKDSWQQVTFQNVAGLEHVVTEVSEVVTYLSNPKRFHALGARPPRGVLLYGPPGSGKTLLARAIAGEARCNAFVACSGSDFVDTFVGRGASRVRKLFDQARRDARAGGGSKWWSLHSSNHADMVPSAVIFIDEIDALAKTRSSFGNNDEREQTLNQLLAEMDGFATRDDDVTMIVIAATNRPEVLDPAIMRRFDRQVHVGYPNVDGREAILMVHARRVNCDMARIDWKHLASSTSAFSGADLRNVVNEAALLAVRELSSTVQQRNLEMAVERVKRMKAAVPSSLPSHMIVH